MMETRFIAADPGATPGAPRGCGFVELIAGTVRGRPTVGDAGLDEEFEMIRRAVRLRFSRERVLPDAP